MIAVAWNRLGEVYLLSSPVRPNRILLEASPIGHKIGFRDTATDLPGELPNLPLSSIRYHSFSLADQLTRDLGGRCFAIVKV
jgi:hypothetical protein